MDVQTKNVTVLAGTEDLDAWRRAAQARGIAFATAAELLEGVDVEVARALPRRFLERHSILPLSRREGAALVATCDADVKVLELAEALGVDRIDYRLVTPTDFRRLRMAVDLGQVGGVRPVTAQVRGKELGAGQPSLDQQLVGLVQAILLDAIAERASDVHLERYGDSVRVRLRIDGDLHDITHFHITPEQLLGMVNVIKVNAGLDIAERRLPQGGRFTISAQGRVFDLRVQTQPALFGEHVVVRLLPQDQQRRIGIEDLGFTPAVARSYRRLLDSPAGLVIVVGPTGSGKSTTLYAGLQVLARDATRKVITVEDPIEYAIDGIQQTQVNADVGFTFSGAMRSFVRQDPDVILVGEVRDSETALEAIRASQTGHLVLTTLHCNDAPDAVQRLHDLGMHANSIASELLAIFAQRLAKRNCAACVAPAVPPQDLAEELFPDGVPDRFRCFRGRGCAQCGGFGTRGRIGVVEYLRSTPDLRRAIARQAALDELRDVALASGMRPMRDQALELVLAGHMPVEELWSLLPPERMAPERR